MVSISRHDAPLIPTRREGPIFRTKQWKIGLLLFTFCLPVLSPNVPVAPLQSACVRQLK